MSAGRGYKEGRIWVFYWEVESLWLLKLLDIGAVRIYG